MKVVRNKPRTRDPGHGTISALQRAVYAAVRLIPRGKVATYGQIAAIIGKPRASRAVGRALRELPEQLADRVPWQRVINAAGRCSERGGFRADRQRDRLEAEGVGIDRAGKVDLRQARWAGPSATQRARLRAQLARTDDTRTRGAASAWVSAAPVKRSTSVRSRPARR